MSAIKALYVPTSLALMPRRPALRPGVGKTTAIREVSRTLSETLRKRVVIVDTSNEIGGDGDIPHDGIGRARRMQVRDPELQHRVMVSIRRGGTDECLCRESSRGLFVCKCTTNAH